MKSAPPPPFSSGRIVKSDFRQRAPTESPPRIWACACSRLHTWEYANLAMPFWRWYWTPDPGAVLLLPERHLALDPRRFYLLPPMTPFGATLRQPVRQLYLHFDLAQRARPPLGEILVHQPDPGELAAARQLLEALQSDRPLADFSTALLAHGVLARTLAAQPPEVWAPEAGDERMRRAVETIRAAFPRITPNERLAREASMNPSAFVRRFRQCLGLTPLQFLHHLRVEQAEQWLREDALSIDQIAERLGFCDRFHFSKAFRRLRQITPATFRRAHRRGGLRGA